MNKNFSSEPTLLLPKATIKVPDYDPITIGGLNSLGVITEVNFYSTLNSFAFNADISIDDVDNIILNKIIEQHGVRVTISMYELPEKIDPFIEIDESNSVKIFQKTFVVDSIEVKKYGITYPYKSVIKIKLLDLCEALRLDKIVHYSNFNIPWDSDEMGVIPTIHKLLYTYEHYSDCKPTVINEKIFGVDLNGLKRRFVTDQSTPLKQVILDYLYSLYDNRWIEYLGTQREFEIPQCLLAFTNQYYLDNKAKLKRIPYLTSVNLLDNDPSDSVFSVPYGDKKDNARILVYAKPEYNLCIEDTAIDLRGSASASMKDQILALIFKKSTFDPFNNLFIDEGKKLDLITSLVQPTYPDIESRQSPTYLGNGDDPDFSLMDYISKNQFVKYPYNIKELKNYFSDGSQSFYADIGDIIFKPLAYVSIPFSAWHSPGQEIDLRMINRMYAELTPEKSLFFSMNKIMSGRWKILNSVTNFKKGKENPNAFGMMPIETLGLGRTRYFHGEEEGK